MKEIKSMQISEEASNIVAYNPKARKCGGNKLRRKCNYYGLTLKYIFGLRGYTYKEVGKLLGITAQSVNHLVNRSSIKSFDDIFYIKDLCRKLNVDYQYFMDLCNEVKRIM